MTTNLPSNDVLADEHAFTSHPVGDSTGDTGASKKKRGRPKTSITAKKRLTKKSVIDEQVLPEAVSKRIDEKLEQIYENTDGSMPDMSTFQKRERRRFVRAFLTLSSTCIILAAVAWVGFFVLQPPSAFSEEDVIVSIAGDDNVAIGADTHYRIRYRNAQSIALSQVVLQVRYPAGFVFSESSPAPGNEAKDEWELGDLAPEQSGFLDIFGRLYGNLGERQSFRVFLNYTPSNFQSEFQKVDSLSVTSVAGTVTLSIGGEKDAVADAEVEVPVTVHVAPPGYTKGPLALELGDGNFTLNKSEPKPTSRNPDQWLLAGDKDQTFVLHGRFRGTDTEKGVMRLHIIGWPTTDRSGESYVFATSSYEATLLQSNVLSQLVINGSSGDMALQPGEALYTSVVVKNVGQAALKDATVRLVFEAPAANNKSILNWQKLDDANSGQVVGEQINPERRRGSITWSKREVPALGTIGPGQAVTIDVHLPVKNSDDEDITQYPTGPVVATAEIQYGLNGERAILTSKPITLTINSDLTLSVDDDVTSMSDKELHTMKWVLNNSFHDLSDMQLEADVYGDVAWQDTLLQVPAGEAHFDRDSKKIIWKISQMPRAVDVLALQFGLLLNQKNPTQTNLTSKVRLKAKDTITGQEMVKVGDEVLLR